MAQKSLYVFNQHGLWLRLANGPNHLREEISLVALPLVLSTQRPRLARNTASEQINISSEVGIPEAPHIRFSNGPLAHIFQAPASVLVQRGTGVMIPFDNSEMLKARAGGTKRQTSSTSKKFEGSHGLGLQKM
jgi:hypothetical protein